MIKLKDKYIDPFTDFGFKKLFGEECNKDLLLDFLNELLHKEEGKIVSLSYLNTDKMGAHEGFRRAVFDLYCENERGEKFLVELQKTKQEYFKDRSLYYSTFAIAEQAVPGEWNYCLKNVYVVAILDFVFEADKQDKEKYRYDVMLTDIETHKIFYEKLQFVYLEMPKFTKEVDELQTRFEKWMYVLKNLKRLNDIPDKLRGKIFERLFKAAEIAKLDSKEYMGYIDELNSYRDLINCLDYAKKEGRAIGLMEGREEGEMKKALTIAEKLLKKGIPLEEVADFTGLSVDVLKNKFA